VYDKLLFGKCNIQLDCPKSHRLHRNSTLFDDRLYDMLYSFLLTCMPFFVMSDCTSVIPLTRICGTSYTNVMVEVFFNFENRLVFYFLRQETVSRASQSPSTCMSFFVVSEGGSGTSRH